MESNEINSAMVDAINRIGHVMGIKTVAEFVENKEILNKLYEIGVDYAQGYEIALPIPIEKSDHVNKKNEDGSTVRKNKNVSDKS